MLISPNKDLFCSGIQTYFSWNNNYLSTILWCFSSITPLEAKIIEILVMSVIKTIDVSKLFLAIFERTSNGLYICYFLCLQHVSININDWRCDFALPHLKRALKNPIKNTYQSVPFLAFATFVYSLSSVPSTSFQVFHQLVPWVLRIDKGDCNKVFD